MKTNVVMPQMGESVTEGTLTVWLKEIGDRVERDEPLFEITTDKVDAEVPSPVAGVLVERLVETGTTVEINALVAVIQTEGDEAPAGDAAPEQAPAPAAAPAPAPATPHTREAAPARAAGAAFDSVKPGPDHSADELRRTRSTPLVRKIAAEHGIQDLAGVPASGNGGRVTRQDIEAFIAQGLHKQAPSATQAPATRAPVQAAAGSTLREIPALPPITMGPRDTTEPMAPQRLAIAKHMIASRATSAHAHTVHEIDFTAVARARQKLKAQFAARDVKLTFTAFMVKAFAEALSRFPLMNCSVDGDQIVYRGDINIGVAVALEDSLIVPVVRNVDELSLLGVARAINDLALRARTKKLKFDEVRGGTFTVSNHGVFGPEFGIPVINQPQVGIVATGAIKKRVVVDQRTDAIMVRPTAIFCMSFDHRVVDGATADKFLLHVRQVLENWEA
jgi:pyruvate dehydrogenase E2 component (dihydrolipoamide acetyltransferase)